MDRDHEDQWTITEGSIVLQYVHCFDLCHFSEYHGSKSSHMLVHGRDTVDTPLYTFIEHNQTLVGG
jgi:hypothetical protein